MWPVTDRFLAALTGSHAVTTRVEAWRGTTLLGTVEHGGGSVEVSARNRVRRTLRLTVPEELWPAEPDDLLSPYGTELQVYRGIDLGDDEIRVPVFRGRVDELNDADQLDGAIEVAASDRMATVNDARFEAPRNAPAGQAITDAIYALIVKAYPGASITVHPGVNTASAVPSGLLWDNDRGKAIDDLAKSLGAEVFAGPDGQFHIRRVPTIADAPVWSVDTGDAGTLVTTGRTMSRDGVYNVVVVVAERANGDPPIRVAVADTDATSPTYVGGAFGRVPRFLKSPLITTEGQADTAGRSLLARSIGATRTRAITCVPNPALDAGDVLTVVVDGVSETHIADTLRLPIHAGGGSMGIGTRSTKPDPGDVTET